MIPKLPKILLYLLIALFALNMVQSYFTELIFDEAYYWYYAQNMAWGYFDHPPMVALMISLSSIFFDGELGVRFVSCILSVTTFLVLWQLIDHPKKERYGLHFFVLVFSMTLINAYGFFTLPDTPFLFFTALFLLLYKKFIARPSAILALGLGVVMAALMYSKYHAVLVILFTLLSNIKLVLNKYAWLSVATALLCYTPHFIWLFENDFVSIKYHLYERPNRAYEFSDFTLGYFINLVALFGFTFPWIYKSLFKTGAKDQFTKALLYLTYGVLIFFFVSSFNRRIQTQWIIVISIPMAIMAFHYLLENENAKKWIYRMGLANIAILLFLRVGLIYEPLFPVVYETHGNTRWVGDIKSRIGDMPVVFENSYRTAPMYAFYSGSPTYSLNNIMYRQNQYTIDDSESKVQHQKILYVSNYANSGDITLAWPDGTEFHGSYIDNFESFRKLRCYVAEENINLKKGKKLTLQVYNPYETNIALEKIKFGVAYLNDYKQVKEIIPLQAIPQREETTYLKARDTTKFSFTLPMPKMEDPGFFKISISENGLYMGINGDNIKLD
ncbi:ArnT family glycosyltransferase [Sediminicola sp. 1XM1-17]|uniref:ArnT family glycosyltransferase n=1 Tax=Sediminicola sp. 1XM1-17 TaxID=3127702 RepID=UPI0030784FBB